MSMTGLGVTGVTGVLDIHVTIYNIG